MQSLQIVNRRVLLEKFPGKGGWTYAALPELTNNKSNRFGWIRVKGSIDKFSFKNYHLMPMGTGHLFLPVKASIRKIIKKEAGDWVNVVLYLDDSNIEIPKEIIECLKDEPKALKRFLQSSFSEQKYFIDWIYGAQKEETKIDRITTMINRLQMDKKL